MGFNVLSSPILFCHFVIKTSKLHCDGRRRNLLDLITAALGWMSLLRSQFLTEQLSHAQVSPQPGWSQPAPAEGETANRHTGIAQTVTHPLSPSSPRVQSEAKGRLLLNWSDHRESWWWFCP